jgi:anti-sigma regulatory factor (Ser/Thr protein kinase)
MYGNFAFGATFGPPAIGRAVGEVGGGRGRPRSVGGEEATGSGGTTPPSPLETRPDIDLGAMERARAQPGPVPADEPGARRPAAPAPAPALPLPLPEGPWPLPDEQRGGRLVLPAVPRGVTVSRQLVREVCRLLGLDEVAEVAELLASEVVTNSVLHASTACLQVVVQVDHGHLMVSVADEDRHPPRLRRPSAEALGGRGLYLLDALAEDWGVVEQAGGKAVWFVLSTVPRPGSGGAPGAPGPPSVDPGTAGG